MSYPVQPYEQQTFSKYFDDSQWEKSLFNENRDRDLIQSFFGMVNRMMSSMLRNDGFSNLSTMIDSQPDSNSPDVKVFGVSSMNVTQISRGADGRPRIIQAHDERRMGPGGIWQTRKALRDPDHGIDRMQIGYFIGGQGEIIERELDAKTGQYRREIKRRGLSSTSSNFNNQWKERAEQALPSQNRYSHAALQLPSSLSSSTYQYY